jgi:hypothetical protein
MQHNHWSGGIGWRHHEEKTHYIHGEKDTHNTHGDAIEAKLV